MGRRLQRAAEGLALWGLVTAGCTAEGPARRHHRDPTDTIPGSTSPTDPTHSPPIAMTEPVTCAAPDTRLESPWELVRGLQWDARPGSGGAWGVLAADLDDDGWTDLVVPGGGGVRLWLGGPDGPIDATDRLPDEVRGTRHRTATAADVDDDGDLDVFVGGRGVDDYLLRNDGTAHFTATFLQTGTTTMGGSFVDLDGDADLDLVVAVGSSRTDPVVLLNDGLGGFTPRPDLVPDDLPYGTAFQMTALDLDGDLAPELYRGNDAGPGGPGNRLAWNDGAGHFTYDGGASGLDLDICTMGLGIGDLNDDLVPDLAMSDCRDLKLMESSSAGVWVDHGDAVGLGIDPSTGHDVPWGVELVDLDNDADLDLYVAYGYLVNAGFPNELIQRDGVYLQGDDGRFTEVSAEWGVAVGQSRGFAVADLNNDGWLDVIKQDWDGRSQIYQSHCGDESWLRVSLDQGEGAVNRRAVGARVVALEPDRRQARWIVAGGTSVASASGPEAHFGLGDAQEVDLEVQWPDGQLDRWFHVPTRRRVTLYREPLR
ncbi:MAG: CRTAC1 family protein [Myxococcota bacterium]